MPSVGHNGTAREEEVVKGVVGKGNKNITFKVCHPTILMKVNFPVGVIYWCDACVKEMKSFKPAVTCEIAPSAFITGPHTCEMEYAPQ